MTIQQNYPAIKSSLNLDFANTKQLDPRITYSRASTGTYYDGKTVAKAEENLLVQSQAFDNGYWTKVAATVSANATTAPDGTTTAEFLILSTESNLHAAAASVGTFGAGNTYTLSVYAKANGYDFISLGLHNGAISAGNESLQNFNLATGTVASSFNTAPTSASITSVGNGWYRCVVTWVISTTTPNIAFFVVNTDANPRAGWAANGTSGIYLWGAQLEQRSFATAYTPTTTAPITNYIPVLQTASAGTPRFDHNPITGESLGLLIEEQRTNLVLQSETFDNASWVKSGATITANAVVSPDGTVDADKLTEDTSTGNHECRQALASTVTGSYTGSVYIKAAGRSRAVLVLFGTNFAYVDATFNLVNGTVVSGNGNGTITPVGNGYYRCTITGAASSAGNTNLYIRADNGTTSSYTGNGTDGLFLWGAQLEAGAFATSYIPTVASQVTRAADNAVMTGTNFSSWYNQNTGTAFIDYATFASGSITLPVMEFSDGTTNNRTLFQNNPAGNSRVLAFVGGSAVVTTLDATAVAQTKVDAAYSVGSWAASYNGAAALTNSYAGVVPNQSQLIIGYTIAGGNPRLNGTIKRIAYYPRRLTNTQIQALTS